MLLQYALSVFDNPAIHTVAVVAGMQNTKPGNNVGPKVRQIRKTMIPAATRQKRGRTITFSRYSAILNCAVFFATHNIATRLINSTTAMTTKTLSRAKPVFSKRYDKGIVNNKMAESTIWYAFILPVALKSVSNGP